MKKIALPCALMITLLSYSPTSGREAGKNAKKIVIEKDKKQDKFDLARLSFSRPVEEILKAEGITASEGKTDALTLAGFVAFQSSSARLLVFDGQPLSESKDGTKNSVVLHYAERTNLIGAYELLLFNPEAAHTLEKRLKHKFGKAVFRKDSAQDKGALPIDENGDVQAGPQQEISYQRWEDKKNGLSYHLIQRKKENKLETAELTVINMKSKDAESWIAFKMLDHDDKQTSSRP